MLGASRGTWMSQVDNEAGKQRNEEDKKKIRQRMHVFVDIRFRIISSSPRAHENILCPSNIFSSRLNSTFLRRSRVRFRFIAMK